MDESKRSILIVDDKKANLTGLAQGLKSRLPNYEIVPWQPNEHEGPPNLKFENLINIHTEMVVTDYDLTTAVKGFFGLAVVAWCQQRGIPVGEYTRLPSAALPQEPNLFELRVPTNEDAAADYITGVVNGFSDLRDRIERSSDVVTTGGSLASILATILERPKLENQFAAYMSRPNAANSFLISSLTKDSNPGDDTKKRLFTYVLGHLLLNSVLKYPGPILTNEMLCAYLAIGCGSFEELKDYFKSARYIGPFGQGRNYYWREDVDDILDDLGSEVGTEDFDSFGDFNRRIVARLVEGEVSSHTCSRCSGTKGGFWCPFTHRAVCERSDCSVTGSSWIPTGAQLCRIERDFFDEWSPILSL